MTDRIRIIKHEAVPGYGSFEVRFPSIGMTFQPAAGAGGRDTALGERAAKEIN
jgi:hypothetical protein